MQVVSCFTLDLTARGPPCALGFAKKLKAATDEVINLDDSTEAAPEQTASSSQGTKVLMPAATAPSDESTASRNKTASAWHSY